MKRSEVDVPITVALYLNSDLWLKSLAGLLCDIRQEHWTIQLERKTKTP